MFSNLVRLDIEVRVAALRLVAGLAALKVGTEEGAGVCPHRAHDVDVEDQPKEVAEVHCEGSAAAAGLETGTVCDKGSRIPSR